MIRKSALQRVSTGRIFGILLACLGDCFGSTIDLSVRLEEPCQPHPAFGGRILSGGQFFFQVVDLLRQLICGLINLDLGEKDLASTSSGLLVRLLAAVICARARSN